MKEFFSIIYAYRNREINRIKISMESLALQKAKNFEVIFIDYGSDSEISDYLKMLLSSYNFVNYHYLPVSHKLWNKSKALNFGINKAKGDFVFIADVDIVFSPDAVEVLSNQTSLDVFSLFTMGYLDEKESNKLTTGFEFKDLKPERFGVVNGMILTTKESLFKVKGFDEFFHFYGSEDVDLYSRLENAGYKSKLVRNTCFYHNFHDSYQKSDNSRLSLTPKLTNVLRINQQHYFYHQREKITIPNGQESWGEVVDKSQSKLLDKPTKIFHLSNILAEVEHFFNEELKGINNEILEVRVFEDKYYNSAKHKVKKLLMKQSQTYCSLKEVNDIILKKILYNYRNSNYSYEISNDLKSIIFKIQL